MSISSHAGGNVRDFNVAVGNWNFTDDGGAISAIALFTVTGDVLVKMCASVDVACTSTINLGTVEVGIAGDLAGLLVKDTVDGTAFQVGDAWSLLTPPDANGVQLADEEYFIGNGADINLNIAAQTLTAGDIDFYCLWRPLSAGATVVAT